MQSISILIPPDHATIKGFTKTNSLKKLTDARFKLSSCESVKATIELTKNLGKF
jgi:hypothetical protein